MKNYLFICVAPLLLGVTACSIDEFVATPKTIPIEFSNAFVNKTTRVVDPSLTTASLSEFVVYGWVTENETTGQVFNKEHVYLDQVENAWVYSNTKYWIDGGVYDFAAISPSDNGEHDIQSAYVANIYGFTSDGATDLVFATSTDNVGDAEADNKVRFTFYHQLSKVRLTFTNGFVEDENIDLKVTNVKITDAYVKGDIFMCPANSGNPPIWYKQEGKQVIEFGSVLDDITGNLAVINAGESAPAANERLIIPSTDTKSYNLTFDVTILQSGVEMLTNTVAATISGVNLYGGFSYNLNAVLTERNVDPGGLEPIEFAVDSFEVWAESNPGDNIA